jgi:hypothetical protein
VLFQNKINLRYCASGWFYYRKLFHKTEKLIGTLSPVIVTTVTIFPSVAVINMSPAFMMGSASDHIYRSFS